MATMTSVPDEDPNKALEELNKTPGEKSDRADLLCQRANANIQLHEHNRARDDDDDDEKAQQLQPNSAPGSLKTRHDWYQTESQVVVTIMMKNAKKDDVFVRFNEKQLTAEVKLLSEDDYCLNLHLLHPIVPEQSTFRILSTKIEIKMKKTEAIRWEKLEGEGTLPNVKHFTPNQYPSSSHYTRNWDKVVGEISEEEKNEKLEGDAALNKLFQQIYSDGSDEVRRAMNKSFMESGGTVLSTNWTDVGKRKVEMNPPEDVEWKKY